MMIELLGRVPFRTRALVLGAITLASLSLLSSVAQATNPPAAQARYVGAVTIDGERAPSGTIVQGRIGDVVCGMASVFQSETEARYVLNVVTDGSLPGCGTDGAMVTFAVAGRPVAVAPWTNFELNTVTLSFVSGEAQDAQAISLAPPSAQARFVGTVLLDGVVPPSGTIVQARIDGTVCGMGRAFEDGATTRYVLNVVADSALPGCGRDGATVDFSVGGQPAGWAPWTNFELHDLALVGTTLQ